MVIYRFIFWCGFLTPFFLNAAPRLLYQSNPPLKKAQSTTTLAIFIHGYGTDHSYFKEEDIIEHSDPHPWARITFHDAPKQRRFFWWTNSNMGQKGDAAQIISFLWDIHRYGYTSVVAMSHSRGGAAWITALHTIWFPEKHNKFWKRLARKLHIPQKTIINRLQPLLEKTTSILVYPLLSVHSAAHQTLRRRYHLSNFLCTCGATAYRTSLSLCSSYSLHFPEAITLLHELMEHRHITGKLLLCRQDKIVGNEFDEVLKQKSYPPLFETTYTSAPNHFCLEAGYQSLHDYLGTMSLSKSYSNAPML